MIKDQTQTSGDGSINAQAGRDVVIQGFTLADATGIANVLMQNTLAEYQRTAMSLVESRLESFTQKILETVAKRNDFSAFGDPDFHHLLSQATRSFARSGDADVENLLVNIIGERAAKQERSTKHLILNEALEIGGKLTGNHLKILAAIFIPRYSIRHVNSLAELGAFCDATLAGFLIDYPQQELVFRHLEYLDCLTISDLSETDLEVIFKQAYSGLFSEGFLEQDIPLELRRLHSIPTLFTTCLRDASRLQFRAMNATALNELLQQTGADLELQKKAQDLHSSALMKKEDCARLVVEVAPNMEAVFSKWRQSLAKNSQLSSVGRALAISYLQSNGEKSFQFDTWLT